MRVLITEDDAHVAGAVGRVFERRGHEVVVEGLGAGALAALARSSFDLLVLDWSLPDVDGPDVVRRLRAEGSTVPVLILTGRTNPRDLVHALEVGADDFLPKVDAKPEVLLARAEALVRRALLAPPPRVLSVGSLTIDEGRRAVTLGRTQVPLAAAELGVLAVLASTPGEVVARRRLTAAGWGETVEPSDNALDTVIKRLRQKLRGSDLSIETVRNQGYALHLAAAGEPATSPAGPARTPARGRTPRATGSGASSGRRRSG